MGKLRVREYVEEGALIPRGYGVAWRDYCRGGAVCYPIPFNLLLGALRSAWLWCMSGWPYQPKWLDKRIREVGIRWAGNRIRGLESQLQWERELKLEMQARHIAEIFRLEEKLERH